MHRFTVVFLGFMLVGSYSFLSFASQTCSVKNTLKACSLNIKSHSLQAKAHVALYGPSQLNWRGLPLLIFLHGRGGDALDDWKGQLMSLGFDSFMQSDEYMKSPFIVVAPQDHFKHIEKSGQDYWLGPIGSHRNWPEFLSQELLEILQKRFSIGMKSCQRIISGISMGAHGALWMGLTSPEKFAGIGAHSPIFRLEMNDVRDFDEDVFGHQEGEFSERSVGSRLVYLGEEIRIPSFIDIGRDDSLLMHEYRSGIEVWEYLEQMQNVHSQSVVRRGVAPNGFSDHSFSYWESMYNNFYFKWYQNIFNTSCL